ncbi:SGNH/GDSL hydrolase family protein [Ornithinimicrobium cryptoxanthini]|uniref:SGNH/GDSL hydrolase family protein n=1 Tax=Ornithinimicrobium cryptoxanthini TaxID=2934161 RepID=UPI002117FD7C|nr:SGNH/GDSL hydrolase family protein [Ornithinimicrobium cryptoxanthini]
MKPSRRTMTSLAAAVALLLPLTASATAAPPSFTYDAIGDSYAAGSGAPDGAAYPEVLNGRMRISLDDFAAVPGATAGPGEGGVNTLAEQLGALDEDTDLVTLTIGGNDIPWSQTVTVCLGLGDVACQGAITAVRARITSTLPGTLDAAYTQVRDVAPNAHVVVTGYAHLFSPEFGDYMVPGSSLLMSVPEQEEANKAADLLNATIAGVVAEHDGFQFVDVTKRFDGHGANSDDPWIHGVIAPPGGAFHPNARGYRAYATALTAGISPKDLRG